MNFQPLLVIGAARSGTKMVRDLIAKHPAVDKVTYDINYVWRLGNESIPHDELSPETLNPRIRQRIHNHFERYSSGASFLIEKTVSNCLRVPYVNAVFPGASFIHLVRDGRDVVESAYRKWTAPPDWHYIWKKVRMFPLMEAPGYALSYAIDTFRKIVVRDDDDQSTWGPRYEGIDEDVASKDLLEVCAIQWACCVEKAVGDLSNLSGDRVLTMRYEDFVRCPREHLEEIARFIGLPPHPYLDLSLEMVSQDNIGKGHRKLDEEQETLIMPHLEGALSLLEYE